jgi:hypothetical protein
MGWVTYIKDSQLGAAVLFDIEKRSAVSRIVEQHGLAGFLCELRKIRRAFDNNSVRTALRFCLAC